MNKESYDRDNSTQYNRPRGGRIPTLEAAIASLPSVAPTKATVDWINAHPAMRRKNSNPDIDVVTITVDDVLYSPHGKAPSQEAVNLLINWASRPAKWFEQHLTEQKRASKGDASEGGTDDDIADIEAAMRKLLPKE